MDNPLLRPSAQSLQKPQVFVKLEFGVSWSSQHPPRKHGYEYKSRALRERNPDFPRHVAAPTTNYLAATSMPPLAQDQQPLLQSNSPSTPQEHTAHPSQRNPQPSSYRGRPRHLEPVPEPPHVRSFPTPQRNEPRAASLDRNGRGRSAPPPLSENNWDVVQAQEMVQVSLGLPTACAAEQLRPASDLWKDLPEVPSRFRLGEDEMPWEGNWTFPMGWEPFLEPDPYLRPTSSSHGPSSGRRESRPQSSGQTLQSPEPADVPSSSGTQQVNNDDDDDPAQKRELEDLASAMMTVDNGFENQWWNQDERGERRHLTALHPPPPETGGDERIQEQQMALGWVGALLPPPTSSSSPDNAMLPEESIGPSFSSMVVSPVSSYSGPSGNLTRSLSTRSDELWFTGGRRG